MNAVVEINVSGACFVALDKPARARTREGVRGFVINCCIRFDLDDDSGAFAPDQFSADKFASTRKRIAPKERRANNFVHQPSAAAFTGIRRTRTMACNKRESLRYIRPVCRCGRPG